MTDYTAVLRKTPETGWWVEIPAAPGCYSEGATIKEAIRNAGEALHLWLEEVDESELPDMAKAEAEHDYSPASDEEEVRLAVVSVDPPGKAVQVAITMREGLLRRIEKAVGPRGRSGFLAEAAEEKLARG